MVSQKVYIEYSGAAPRDKGLGTLSPPYDADAPNQVKCAECTAAWSKMYLYGYNGVLIEG